jgi:hypothetical protein
MAAANFFYYCAPLAPLFSRGLLCVRFLRQMNDLQTDAEQAREAHRAYIFPLAGFSFSALLALVVLDATLNIGLDLPIYYLLISFLCYLIAINLQAYKIARWIDQVATTAMDIGTLSLLFSLVSLIFIKAFGYYLLPTLSILAITAWVIDHTIRLHFIWLYLREKEKGG